MPGKSAEILQSALPVVPILAPLGVHFVLLCFVLLSQWLPLSYIFYHLIMVGVGLWASHAKTEIKPVIVYIVVVAVSILMDIIQLGLFFPGFQQANGSGLTPGNRTWQFSAGMCIVNLLFKPVTLVLASLTVYIRAGGNIGAFGTRGESYNNIHGSDNPEASE